MNVKTTATLLAVGLFLGRDSRAVAQPVRIELSMPKAEYVLGEPIVVEEAWRNTSESVIVIAYGIGAGQGEVLRTQVIGPVRQGCVEQGKSMKTTWCPHEELGGNQTVRHAFSLATVGAVDEGDYEIWRVYDATGLPPTCDVAGRSIDWLTTKVESNHLRFRIVKPRGVDAQVFDKYRQSDAGITPGRSGDQIGRCNQLIVNDETIKTYPDSIYVAYALFAKGRPGYSSPEAAPPDSPAEQEFMKLERERSSTSIQPADRRTYERFYEQELKKQRDIIDALEQLTRNFPDFPYRRQALFELARAHFRVGEPEKAASVLRDLLSSSPGSELANKAAAYRRVLQDKGFWSEPTASASPAP